MVIWGLCAFSEEYGTYDTLDPLHLIDALAITLTKKKRQFISIVFLHMVEQSIPYPFEGANWLTFIAKMALSKT